MRDQDPEGSRTARGRFMVGRADPEALGFMLQILEAWQTSLAGQAVCVHSCGI